MLNAAEIKIQGVNPTTVNEVRDAQKQEENPQQQSGVGGNGSGNGPQTAPVIGSNQRQNGNKVCNFWLQGHCQKGKKL